MDQISIGTFRVQAPLTPKPVLAPTVVPPESKDRVDIGGAVPSDPQRAGISSPPVVPDVPQKSATAPIFLAESAPPETSAPASQPLTLAQALQELQQPVLSERGQKAFQLLQRLEQEPPAPRPAGEIPLTKEERLALNALQAEAKPLAERLLKCLQKQHPEAAWLAEQGYHGVDEARAYDLYTVESWNQLCAARKVGESVQNRDRLKLEGSGINLAEAQGVYFLGKHKPQEAQELIEGLSVRGDKARWIAERARSGNRMGDGVSERFLEELNQQWTARCSAYAVLAQLEKKVGNAAPAGPVPPEPTLTMGEARALWLLRGRDKPAGEKLLGLLTERNSSDGWIARKLLESNSPELNSQKLHDLENRRSQHIQAYQLIQKLQSHPPEQGAWRLSDQEAELHQALNWDDPDAARTLKGLLGQRHPGIGWALDQLVKFGGEASQMEAGWGEVERGRATIRKLETAPVLSDQAITLDEAHALQELCHLSLEDARQLGGLLEARGPMQSWIVQEFLKSPTMIRPPMDQQVLQGLEMRWHDLSAAEAELNALQKPDRPVQSVPVTLPQAMALHTLRRNYGQGNYEKSRQMAELLKQSHPDGTWFLDKLEEIHDLDAPLYQQVLQSHQDLVASRTTLQALGGDRPIDFDQALALRNIWQSGREEEKTRAQEMLLRRGPRAQVLASQIYKLEQLNPENFAAAQQEVERLEPAFVWAETLLKEEPRPVPEGQLPVSSSELEFYLQLRDANWAVGHTLSQALLERSSFIKSLPQDLNTLGPNPERELTRHHDAWMLTQAAGRMGSSQFHMGAWELEQPPGITSSEQADDFVSLWQKAQKILGHRPDPGLIGALCQNLELQTLSGSQLSAVLNHLQGNPAALDSLPGDPESLRIAALAWQVDPQLPAALAQEAGGQGLPDLLRSSLAWRLDAENFAAKREELAQLKNPQLVALLPPEQLPSAIELMQGRALNPSQRVALYAGLRNAPNPIHCLLQLKGAAFKEALEAVNPLFQVDSQSETLEPYDYKAQARAGWENRGAVALALTFRGSWRQWLDAQAKIRGADGEPQRRLHDVVDMLPLQPGQDLPGLESTLLKHAQQPLADLQLLVGRWPDLEPAERELPFAELLEVARKRAYPHAQSADFAAEACRWGVAREDYPEMEERFLASQQLASPVQEFLNEHWQAGELRGRFLPRSDARGLFLGHHTGCCQHPSGAGAECAWHGQENPRGSFFVLENPQGEVVAQSWAWVSQEGGLVFDNVEGYRLQGKQSEAVQIYQQAADRLSSQFPLITMGTGLSKLPTSGWPAAAQGQTPVQYEGYLDSEEQVVLKQR